MVKVGFICEGKTEKQIVKSKNFQDLLHSIGIESVDQIIDAAGNGNLLPNNLRKLEKQLVEKGADRIVVITDLDADACITNTKNRIDPEGLSIIVISVKAVESWFLADSFTLCSLLREDFEFEFPENQVDPYNTLKGLFLTKTGIGIGTKILFTKKIIKSGFSLENAARHKNCPSAAYFLNKLKQLAAGA